MYILEKIKPILKKSDFIVFVVRYIKAIYRNFISFIWLYNLIKFFICKIKLFEFSYFRKIFFELSNSYLIADCNQEIFVVSNNDKAIARKMYVTKKTFDADKLESVASVICGHDNIDTIIDVGANIGVTCIAALNRGYFKKGLAIEPDKINYQLLKINCILNNLENRLEIINSALGSNSQEKVVLEKSDVNYGDHRIRRTNEIGEYNEQLRKIVEVDSTTLDDISKSYKNISIKNCLLWIDTQGFEGHVLSGAKKFIRNGVPICLEFWPYGMERAGGYEVLRNSLSSSNYKKIYDLKSPHKSIQFSLEELDKLYNTLNLNRSSYTDILITT